MKAKSHLVHNSLKEVKITKLIPNLSSRLVFNIGMSGLFHDILLYIYVISYIIIINGRFATIPMRIIIMKTIHHDG